MIQQKEGIVMETKLSRFYNKRGDADGTEIYTHDSWKIPDEGAEIWCTCWKRGQTIKPYGDGCHVIVGCSVYHCDQFMEIMDRNERDGYAWGIAGVKMEREQYITGCWTKVNA